MYKQYSRQPGIFIQIVKLFAEKVLTFQGCASIKGLDVRGNSVAHVSSKIVLLTFLGWLLLYWVPSTIHFILHRQPFDIPAVSFWFILSLINFMH